MKPLAWGAISAVIFVSVWTLASVTGTTMPTGFATMQPMGLASAGVFWGAVLCMIRDRLSNG